MLWKKMKVNLQGAIHGIWISPLRQILWLKLQICQSLIKEVLCKSPGTIHRNLWRGTDWKRELPGWSANFFSFTSFCLIRRRQQQTLHKKTMLEGHSIVINLTNPIKDPVKSNIPVSLTGTTYAYILNYWCWRTYWCGNREWHTKQYKELFHETWSNSGNSSSISMRNIIVDISQLIKEGISRKKNAEKLND